MRIGINPAKLDSKIEKKYHHRIIIPVYVPNFEGYFQNLFEVIKLCIESAYLTQHGRSAITVVDNASCKEVKSCLQEKLQSGEIETLITNGENIGKVDAIMGAARASREDLITLTDCDILFKNNWQEEVEKVFLNFENVGSVAPFPIARHLYYHTSSTLKAVLTNRMDFSFQATAEDNQIAEVYNSYGWNYEKEYDGLLPVVQSKGIQAVIGSGHQVFTIRRELFFQMPLNSSFIKIGNESETIWIDEPINNHGFLRLSTLKNWVSHMGNNLTPNEKQQFEAIKKNQHIPEIINLAQSPAAKINKLEHRVWMKVFKKLKDHRPEAPQLIVQHGSL
jgi:hypothetical protein